MVAGYVEERKTGRQTGDKEQIHEHSTKRDRTSVALTNKYTPSQS